MKKITHKYGYFKALAPLFLLFSMSPALTHAQSLVRDSNLRDTNLSVAKSASKSTEKIAHEQPENNASNNSDENSVQNQNSVAHDTNTPETAQEAKKKTVMQRLKNEITSYFKDVINLRRWVTGSIKDRGKHALKVGSAILIAGLSAKGTHFAIEKFNRSELFDRTPAFNKLIKAVLDGKKEEVAKILSNSTSSDNKTFDINNPVSDEDIDASIRANRDEITGKTALQIAVQKGDPKIVELLLTTKANPNLGVNDKGRVPLHEAATQRPDNPDILRVLIEHKAYVNQRDLDGATPLFLCASNNANSTGVRCLLEALADPEIADNEERLPLHKAAGTLNINNITQLLDARPGTIIKVNQKAHTPLHFAVVQSRDIPAALIVPVVELLIKRGADPRARNTQGQTPAAMATHVGVREQLQSHISQLDQAAAIKTNQRPEERKNGGDSNLLTKFTRFLESL